MKAVPTNLGAFPLWLLPAAMVAALLGVVALRVLGRRGWFHAGGAARAGLAEALGLGAVLTIPVIAVDLCGGFPREMNVRAPDSLVFYPLVAVLAELVLHAVPLAALAVVVPATVRSEPARWMSMVLVSLLEPLLQVVWGAEHSPVWANTYVGFHVLAFNLIGLHFFRRYGFATVLTYRLAYYALWHVVWGHVRLDLLFGGRDVGIMASLVVLPFW